jgi:GDPmannose 4,6-dehydratase
LLEIARSQPHPPRFFQASSAEIFGRPAQAPQNEATPVAPVTPYGCAMAFATHLVRTFRHAHGLFACCGIMYNHESPRRGEAFVTRKICRAVAAIRRGEQSELALGNLDSRRDWGHARDFVQAMWLALQQPEPRDYVLATGVLHSVREVVEAAFAAAGLDWRAHVRQDPALFRPAEPFQLVGDPGLAARELGWRADTSFDALIGEMVAAELAPVARSPVS